jgi:hypothetical protein
VTFFCIFKAHINQITTMKNNYLRLLLFFFSLTWVISCSDEDKPAPTKTELISRNWLIQDLLYSDGGTPISIIGFMEACDKDNILQIKNDNTYKELEGATKCNAADPDIAEQGTWAFAENETKIQLTALGESRTFSLLELTSSSLKVSYKDITLGTGTATLVLKAQ